MFLELINILFALLSNYSRFKFDVFAPCIDFLVLGEHFEINVLKERERERSLTLSSTFCKKSLNKGT